LVTARCGGEQSNSAASESPNETDRIYTRSGDDGRTSLGDGARLPKFHSRVAAYGSIDEAGSVIGIALLYVDDAVVPMC
jgi:cob(I)alamin adenosyltransferase